MNDEPGPEELLKDLQSHKKWVEEQALRTVNRSRFIAKKTSLPIFMAMVERANGAVCGPYWYGGQDVKFHKGERAGETIKGRKYIGKSITRTHIFKTKKINRDWVDELMELNEDAKYIRAIRFAIADCMRKVARTLQSSGDLITDLRYTFDCPESRQEKQWKNQLWKVNHRMKKRGVKE